MNQHQKKYNYKHENNPTDLAIESADDRRNCCINSLAMARTTSITIDKALTVSNELTMTLRKLRKCSTVPITVLAEIEENERAISRIETLQIDVGKATIGIINNAEKLLSLQEFCSACGVSHKQAEAERALAEYEAESDKMIGKFMWLIYKYGIESNDNDFKEGPFFDCVSQAIIDTIMNSSELKMTARSKLQECFSQH